jgi:hypothetical protein
MSTLPVLGDFELGESDRAVGEAYGRRRYPLRHFERFDFIMLKDFKA